eukprot:TRINITY_DN8482_c0_g1_i1.p1 TRINITY_DN8482_c0_g1~~TRINITY_DN8482_c0_g1_i1.p1  ORF type:complete len:447 (-),score=48.59 TRINITY_DN8482_c0_g1_i1:73-1413(-)
MSGSPWITTGSANNRNSIIWTMAYLYPKRMYWLGLRLIEVGEMRIEITIIVSLVTFITITLSNDPYIEHEWVTLDYDWECQQQKQYYLDNGLFIPEKNVLAGIKAYRGVIYVTVPRWFKGVPSTLNKIVNNTLQPYPSWEMQNTNNPASLKYVQSMEIDTRGWMWILDVGRLNIFEEDPNDIVNGPPKLVIWDIIANCSVREYVFPTNVYPYDGSFANDIVVDETNGFAYLTDTYNNGGIIIYDFNKNMARRFDSTFFLGPSMDNTIDINDRKYPVVSPSDGIALTYDTNTLYFCTLSRIHLYSIDTLYLQNFTYTNLDIEKHVNYVGRKGYSDGMTATADNYLVFGDLENSAVKMWKMGGTAIAYNTTLLVKDAKRSQWPDTFGFDREDLIYVSNKLQYLFFGGYKWDGSDGANFRVWRVPFGKKSYMTQNPKPYYLYCRGSHSK